MNCNNVRNGENEVNISDKEGRLHPGRVAIFAKGRADAGLAIAIPSSRPPRYIDVCEQIYYLIDSASQTGGRPEWYRSRSRRSRREPASVNRTNPTIAWDRYSV